ncbi:centromere protein J [Chanos chanos]|uniref:Centromere protein J n=1 Tax=Chanos chanos TaxID=29144 RepID=A0A6J2WAM0_CHACN|nr:centromere protein J [Chanos chanos]
MQTHSSILSSWVPSSSRAGVILNGSPGGTGSVRSSYSSLVEGVDDSFCSQFAPLPASIGSSVDAEVPLGSGPSQGASTHAYGPLNGGTGTVEEILKCTQDLPLVTKLEQLKKWQQHMQEQLKAHQLEELLRLQDVQHGVPHRAQHETEVSESSGSCLGEESPGTGLSHLVLSPTSHTHSRTRTPETQFTHSHQQDQTDEEEQDSTQEASRWSPEKQSNSGDDQSAEISVQSMREDQSVINDKSHTGVQDRPIRPNPGGRTFEELLEQQLKLEDQRLTGKNASSEPVKVKRPFLRRGEGLSRFTRGKAPGPHRGGAKTHISPRPSPSSDGRPSKGPEPSKASQRCPSTAGATGPRVPIQRKTAVRSKENLPQNVTSLAVTKTTAHSHVTKTTAHSHVTKTTNHSHVLGMHQGTNIASVPLRPQTQIPGKPNSSAQLKVGSVTVVSEKIDKSGSVGVTERAQCVSGSGERDVRPEERDARVAEHSFEVWFAERGERWEREHQREFAELGEFELLEQAADELSFSSNSSFVRSLLNRDPRRLSSTPIKAPRLRNQLNPLLEVPAAGGKSERAGVCVSVRQGKVMPGSTDGEEVEEDKHVESNASSQSSLDFCLHQAASAPPASECFRVTEPPYDKRSYQDGERAFHRDGRDGNASDQDSTLVGAGEQVEFDDDNTWHESEEITPCSSELDSFSQPERTLTRKVATAKGVEPEGCTQSRLDDEPKAQPTSQLVAKLFPALKPKPVPPTSQQKESALSEQATVQSRLLRERLVELETEIERFKRENAALARLQRENREAQESLRKERAEFERQKAEEQCRWEEFKQEESRKLQRERKLFEKHCAATRARPDKQEREEIQSLRQQLSSLQEDVKRRETRWTSAQNRLRQQIDSLTAENASLREQVHALEKLRLHAWKHAERERRSESREGEREKGRGRSVCSDGRSSAANRRTKSRSPCRSVKSSPPQGRGSSDEIPQSQSPLSLSTSSGSSCGSQRKTSPQASPGRSSDDLVTSDWQSLDTGLSEDSTQLVSSEPDVQRFPVGQGEMTHSDGKTEKALPDGGRLIVFPNGTRKELSADGRTAKVTFFNGDVKHVTADQRVIYYYAEAQTTHTTYPDGMEVLQFPNGQTEKHFPDGRKEITFPDQTVKTLHPDGTEESVLTDGTIVHINPDGSKQIQFNTGQRELHTAEFKRREYPDGTVKTVYSDGRQETRYPTGRLRLKDPQGRVVMDTKT